MGRIILIPGLLCDAFAWQGILAHLPADTYIADNTRQTTITAMAETCLEETKGALQVAGHSMGARVVLEMVRLEPNRIEKMALLDTGIHGLKKGEPDNTAKTSAEPHRQADIRVRVAPTPYSREARENYADSCRNTAS